MGRKLKMFVGNYDGTRRGLVISTSKKDAAEIARTSLQDFNRFWREAQTQPDWFPQFKPRTLYTSSMFYGIITAGDWKEGRCDA